MACPDIFEFPVLLAGSLARAVTLGAISCLSMGITPSTADEAPGLAQARAAHGLPMLHLDPTLERVAHNQTHYMAAAGDLSHAAAPGLDFPSRMIRSGFGRRASENIGRGPLTDRQIVRAWMNSTSHRNNILDPSYSRYGFASATDPANPQIQYWSLVIGR